MLLSFAVSSLKSRAKSVVLTFLSLLISISVLLSVEHVRMQAESSFSRTVSDVDLIVGAPSGQLNLMLYSIFRMGSPTNNISYESVEMLKGHSQVEWVIPISLGDSHHGFRVLGTSQDYFEHYKYGDKQRLTFASGQPFAGVFGAVIGADVAKKLGYHVGDKIVIAHGTGMVSFTNHDQSPFTITGILAATGTPVDKTVHVSLEGIEAMHLSPSKLKPIVANPDDTSNPLIQPDDVTAVMLGLKSKFATFTLQRELNNYQDDRLMAILPGVAMAELWKMMGTVENLLRIISVLVLVSSLFGLSTMLLASMQQREKEIAVLRILGAGGGTIFMLLLTEALLIAIAASVVSTSLLTVLFSVSKGWLASEYGLFMSANFFSVHNAIVIGAVLAATIVTTLLPAIDAYRKAIHSRL
ncbi:ABC transporter permease [Alteromonas confluentis]|uniref:Peptide ABC transporter permease n=1 Tax=Alteromonas confluentis TaxID=1656094 RepID=A0A1E7ZA38_9ALTE|nr:ABC transporter permease [Alteromonas confluentis]OFC70337.1 peptide ABC transporter permease [Alteromonas confluentis]